MKASKLSTTVSFPLSTFFKKSVLCTAIACSMGIAQAQDVDNLEEASNQSTKEKKTAEEQIEVIEVRGILASAAANLSIKRLSNSVVDAITAEDIGKFPDKNIADSLQRVPGVVISRDGGEGDSVSIRGLSSDLTFTQLNGNFIASSQGAPSRSFSYSLLPSTLIERVELYKSSEARLDEGGIGGTVLVHSRKPLNMDKNSGILRVESTYSDLTDKNEPQFNGIYSWKNDEENFGVLVGYTKQERTNRSQLSSINILNSNFKYQERANGQAVDGGAIGYAPQSMVQEVLEEKRDREGVQITSQWRLNDALELGFNYFHFSLGQDAIKNQLEYPEWHNKDAFWTNVRVDEDLDWVTGIDYASGVSGAEGVFDIPRINGEFIREESTSDTFDFYADYEGDDFNAKFVIGHTEGEGGPTKKYRAAYYPKQASTFYGYDLSNQNLTTYMDPNMFTNLQAGIGGDADVGATDSSFITGTQEEDYAQLDVDYFLDMGIVETLRFGVKYRDGKIHRESRNTFYLSPDFDIDAALANGGEITIDDDYSRHGGIPSITDVLADQPLDNLSDAVNTNLFPAVNWNAYDRILEENFVRYTRNEKDFVYEVEEEILSAYVQADYKYENFRGNFGLRYVDTTTTSIASDRIVYRLDRYRNEDTSSQIEEAIGRPKEIVVVEKEENETHLLPSFNFVWDVDDNWVVRAAAAKVMARPSYGDLGSFQTLTYTSSEYSKDKALDDDFDPIRDAEGWRGSGGNSTLKSITSIQYDLSLEYYYGGGSGASIAVFEKNLENFVLPVTIDVMRSLEVREFTLTEPGSGNQTVTAGGDFAVKDYDTSGNAGKAKSSGIEFTWQHFFDNGFGFNANYTLNNTNEADIVVEGEIVGKSALPGSTDYQANASIFYENDVYGVRASYNRKGRSIGGNSLLLTELDPESGTETYHKRFGDTYDQIDVNGHYNYNDNIILTLSVINLTKSESYNYVGDKERFSSRSYGGRRIDAGITYRF
jgi:TonB-dependent receptor